MISSSNMESKLLYRLQQGLPLEWRPYEKIGFEMGISEQEVISHIQQFRKEGKIRRIGAVFNVSQLGYQSTLCGIACPISELDRVAELLDPHPGITHCYSRSARTDRSLDPLLLEGETPVPNLWFTFSVFASQFDQELENLQSIVPYPIRIAPAVHKFKVQVVLDPSQIGESGHSKLPDSEVPWIGTEMVHTTPAEQALISQLHQDLPDCPTPFKNVCENCIFSPEVFLDRLHSWKSSGVLRRIAVLARHQKMGFSANAMCTWKVPPEQVARIGSQLASRPEITHCYERKTFPGFPFNMFAMIHSGSEKALTTLVNELSQELHLPAALVFHSEKEYKKTSLIPFLGFSRT